MKSVVHVSYTGWLILPYSALARTHDFKNFLSSILVFCCKTFTCFGTMPRIVACVCSPLCHHLYTIFHWYRRRSVLMCLQSPVSLSSCFCTSFSAAPLRIASSRYYRMSNDDLNKLLSLPRGTVFSTWRLLDSSVGTTLCLPSDLI